MKSEERHKLKENDFAKLVQSLISWISDHAILLLVLVVGAILIITGSWYFSYTKEMKNDEAGKQIGQLMNDLGVDSINNISSEKISLLEDAVSKYKSTKNGAVYAYKLGSYFENNGKIDKAKEYYQISLENLKNNNYVYHRLANLEIDNENYKKALDYLKQIDKSYEMYDNILYLMYISAEKEGNKEIVTNIKKEFEKEEYKDSKYKKMLKIREAL
ncbi:MAG TPA: tetratricopeptide repeat protein [Candidatus Mcinerneyibacterium sp.]|nr:tetratricopeptide repeat protein [Candidatus Mcinerneyibacterium sp.]